ncbi:LysR family transcriptional regulator [Limnobacter humi]|uniref:LysR family transcriptional regulator n=1 Tax=Limnobacter humi TaxID=1778671 RepID=A0ABT1WIR2_9BURK|nr:LysR family transcriptional regulator [Limnobacter humi]
MQKNTGQQAAKAASPQWDDIRYFHELAKAGSLSGAARALGVEHSTVARRMDVLEAALGVRLFDRLSTGWCLTPEGETLATQAERLDQEAQAFSRAALGVASLKGTVRISAPPVLVGQWLVPGLAALRQQWQHINLDMIGETRDANLARGEADLAIRMSRPNAPGLVARSVGHISYGLFAKRGYCRKPESEWEFLAYDDSLAQVPQQQWLNKVADGRPFIFRSNDLLALLNAARAGLGLAVLPYFLVRGDKTLEHITSPACPVKRQVWLVMHPGVRRSPRVRLMADLLANVVGSAQC